MQDVKPHVQNYFGIIRRERAAGTCAGGRPLQNRRKTMKKILLDTDIGPDCDDAAALALVNMYAAEGMVEVLDVTH